MVWSGPALTSAPTLAELETKEALETVPMTVLLTEPLAAPMPTYTGLLRVRLMVPLCVQVVPFVEIKPVTDEPVRTSRTQRSPLAQGFWVTVPAPSLVARVAQM